MNNFIPDAADKEIVAPFFEDASNSVGVVGYRTERTEKTLKSLITVAFARLGGIVSGFQSGKFGNRYGYRIDFSIEEHKGRIDISALPIKKETPRRIDQAKRHSLYSLWNRLEAEYNTALVMPGDVPLVPYMLVDGDLTMLEYMREKGQLPALPESVEEIIEGEFSEA